MQESIDRITEEYLQALIDNKKVEEKIIEYKSELPDGSSKEKAEFYKDVSAFANAEGGNLIYGVVCDGKTRLPKELRGLDVISIDNEITRLNLMIRTGIEPSIIPEPEIYPVDLPRHERKKALIIKIRQSITAPHRIAFTGKKEMHNKFYIRTNSGANEMSITELRNVFNLSGNLVERIQNFRMERLQKLIVGDTPVPLSKKDGKYKSKMMVHLIPLRSFSSAQFIDINSDKNYKILKNKLIPIGVAYGEERFNLDGFLKLAKKNERNETFSYTQFFRNGIIEAVFGAVLSEALGENEFPLDYIRNQTLKNVYKYLNLLNELSVSPPVYVFLTFYDVKGIPVHGAPSDAPKIDRNLIRLPEVVINKFVQDENKLEMLLKPMFDTLENVLGNKAS